MTEMLTVVPAAGIRRRGDLLVKSYERMFRARVPLPEQAYAKITFTDPWSYAELGEAVEAWGFRLHAARAPVHGPRRDRPPVVRRRVPARWCGCSGAPT